MKRSTTTALVAGALVLGLTLGGVCSATAATDDAAVADEGLDRLFGQAGKDLLVGGKGDDRLKGGKGILFIH